MGRPTPSIKTYLPSSLMNPHISCGFLTIINVLTFIVAITFQVLAARGVLTGLGLKEAAFGHLPSYQMPTSQWLNYQDIEILNLFFFV